MSRVRLRGGHACKSSSEAMPMVREVRAQVCDPSHSLVQWFVFVVWCFVDSRHFDVVSPMIPGSQKAVRYQTDTKYSLSKALPETLLIDTHWRLRCFAEPVVTRFFAKKWR